MLAISRLDRVCRAALAACNQVRQIAAEVAVPFLDPKGLSIMEPTSGHERAIAQAVDKEFQNNPGGPYEALVSEIAASLGFLTSDADTNFLVSYSQWRFENPIVPRKAKAATTVATRDRRTGG